MEAGLCSHFAHARQVPTTATRRCTQESVLTGPSCPLVGSKSYNLNAWMHVVQSPAASSHQSLLRQTRKASTRTAAKSAPLEFLVPSARSEGGQRSHARARAAPHAHRARSSAPHAVVAAGCGCSGGAAWPAHATRAASRRARKGGVRCAEGLPRQGHSRHGQLLASPRTQVGGLAHPNRLPLVRRHAGAQRRLVEHGVALLHRAQAHACPDLERRLLRDGLGRLRPPDNTHAAQSARLPRR